MVRHQHVIRFSANRPHVHAIRYQFISIKSLRRVHTGTVVTTSEVSILPRPFSPAVAIARLPQPSTPQSPSASATPSRSPSTQSSSESKGIVSESRGVQWLYESGYHERVASNLVVQSSSTNTLVTIPVHLTGGPSVS